ncbi:hypothetical protein [Xanthovirga aplysinae]|uniref:hypothetical protein n=1 Tax=Xanthovirga aplysinae TaxID=2529853 RepID=UPI0012BD1AB7|nr:hypothetical protein [Xanthovirga aplysinae]MTI30483.1 hypothetical protein [Xanthovirga aplysinae]
MKKIFAFILFFTVLSFSAQAQLIPQLSGDKEKKEEKKKRSKAKPEKKERYVIRLRVKGLKGLSASGFYTPNGFGGALGYRYGINQKLLIEPMVQYSYVKHSSTTNMHQGFLRGNLYYNLYRFKLVSINPYFSPMVAFYNKLSNIQPNEDKQPWGRGKIGAALGVELENYVTYNVKVAMGGGQRALYTGDAGFHFQIEGFLSIRYLFNAVGRADSKSLIRFF